MLSPFLACYLPDNKFFSVDLGRRAVSNGASSGSEQRIRPEPLITPTALHSLVIVPPPSSFSFSIPIISHRPASTSASTWHDSQHHAPSTLTQRLVVVSFRIRYRFGLIFLNSVVRLHRLPHDLVCQDAHAHHSQTQKDCSKGDRLGRRKHHEGC